MGFVKNMKSDTLAKEASKALEDGATFFTPLLNTPASHHGMSGNIADWSQMIQAVEAVGWMLTDWAVAMDHKGRPEAYPLFRRRN